MRRRAAALWAALAAASCASPFGPSEEALPVTRLRGEPHSFTWHSGLVLPERVVIRDAASWAAIWGRIWSRVSSPPALPEIDFSREMVVVAALGERPTNGYDILVESATAAGRTVTVSLRSLAGCGLLPVVTHPVDVARLPRRDGEVRFLEQHEARGCS